MLDWVKKLIGVAKASEDKIGLGTNIRGSCCRRFAPWIRVPPSGNFAAPFCATLPMVKARVCSPRFPSFQILSIGCAFDWKILSFGCCS